jgi:Flp pilus assembly protein TadD
MSTPLERALRHHRRGELAKAESLYRRILESSPEEPEALHLLGCVELAKGNRSEAVRSIARAIARAPEVALYHENLAEAYHRGGEPELAERECHEALRLSPDRPQALNLLGVVALERADYEAARAHLSQALQLKAAYPEALINLAVVLNRIGEHALAAGHCALALKLNARSPLAWSNLGMAYKGLGRIREAKEAFSQAGDFPIAKFNLGYMLLLEDDLASGLPLCEWRKKLFNPGHALVQPEWDGRDCGGRLLVMHEQGMGDTILMSRFFAPLLERFAQVTVVVPAPLTRLIAALDRRLDVRGEVGDARFDFWCGVMSLPLLLGIRSAGAIPTSPWLPVPRAPRRDGPPRIGINWAGNPSFHYDRIRSTSLESLAPLLGVPGVEWVSLHKGHCEHEAERYGLPQPLREARDFYDTAVVLAGLEMVVSTETAVPNLSAALGTPTCVLVAVDHDWRWRSWYRDVAICSQEEPGVWAPAVQKALSAVTELTRAAA